MAAPAEILARREARQAEQVALLGRHPAPVVSFTLVAPGPVKDDAPCQAAFAAGLDAVTGLLHRRGWRVAEAIPVAESTGPEWLASVAADPRELKAALVELETSEPLGRLWDLDVLSGLDAGLPVIVGRRAIDLPPRRCLVCAGDAAGCARSRAHPLPVVLAARDALVALAGPDRAVHSSALSMRSEASDRARIDREHALGCTLAALATEALLVEARLTPKPGLVDAATPGAHPDMDLALLERSATALHDWFAGCWWAGVATAHLSSGATTARLVELGIAGETAMRAATQGVNTHKGALFGIGLVLGAHGRRRALGRGAPDRGGPASFGHPSLAEEIAGLAQPLLADWANRAAPDDSHGARALRELGLPGARGEAAAGFATVTAVGLPAYRTRLAETGDENDALRWTLVALIAVNPDTNLVARGGAEGLADARAWASDVVRRRPGRDELVAELDAADRWFTERRLSPGGSADLLALTWLWARLSGAD